MPIPEREIIKAELVRYILKNGGDKKSLRTANIYDGLAEVLGLTPEDRARRRQQDTFWENEVRWARQSLVDQHYILPVAESGWDVWTLAETVTDYSPNSSPTNVTPPKASEPELQSIHSGLTAEGFFSPSNLSSGRKLILRSIVQRRGQNNFRLKLIEAYKACCVTEEATISVLEAAHIIPYKGDGTNHVQNGLLLRSDIHTLFDLKLLSVNPSNYTVILCPELKSSSYGRFDGIRIRLPENEQYLPSVEALDSHRKSCQF